MEAAISALTKPVTDRAVQSGLPSGPCMREIVDREAVARLAAQQLQVRQQLRPERELASEAGVTTTETGVEIVLAGVLRCLRAGVEEVAFADLHRGLLGDELGRRVVSEQLAVIRRCEELLSDVGSGDRTRDRYGGEAVGVNNHQRRRATRAQIASTKPNGQAPCRKP